MSQNWEYSVREFRTVDAGGLTQCINKLAEDGWELISVSPGGLHYFKRAPEPASEPEQDEIYGLRQA
jgi:hypothetical protein